MYWKVMNEQIGIVALDKIVIAFTRLIITLVCLFVCLFESFVVVVVVVVCGLFLILKL
jgi:hypothetical protein